MPRITSKVTAGVEKGLAISPWEAARGFLAPWLSLQVKAWIAVLLGTSTDRWGVGEVGKR